METSSFNVNLVRAEYVPGRHQSDASCPPSIDETEDRHGKPFEYITILDVLVLSESCILDVLVHVLRLGVCWAWKPLVCGVRAYRDKRYNGALASPSKGHIDQTPHSKIQIIDPEEFNGIGKFVFKKA